MPISSGSKPTTDDHQFPDAIFEYIGSLFQKALELAHLPYTILDAACLLLRLIILLVDILLCLVGEGPEVGFNRGHTRGWWPAATEQIVLVLSNGTKHMPILHWMPVSVCLHAVSGSNSFFRLRGAVVMLRTALSTAPGWIGAVGHADQQ